VPDAARAAAGRRAVARRRRRRAARGARRGRARPAGWSRRGDAGERAVPPRRAAAPLDGRGAARGDARRAGDGGASARSAAARRPAPAAARRRDRVHRAEGSRRSARDVRVELRLPPRGWVRARAPRTARGRRRAPAPDDRRPRDAELAADAEAAAALPRALRWKVVARRADGTIVARGTCDAELE
jgi:hypothetical protein